MAHRLGYDTILAALDKSLANLKLDYLDLYLIHWPVPSRDKYVETWRALEKIQDDGLTRSIGVANFPSAQLERLFAETDTVPAVNQIELHPRLPQAELREFNARHGIATQAWSPLGHGQLISDPTVVTIAERRGKTAAQILLRWNLELGNAVISKSVTPERIRTNMEIFRLRVDQRGPHRAGHAGHRNPHRPGPRGLWSVNAATHARTASRSRIRRIASTTVYRFGGVYSPACHSSHATMFRDTLVGHSVVPVMPSPAR